jgi:hypothetical protein
LGDALAAFLKSLADCQQSANTFVNFLQNHVASMRSDFFQGQMDRGLFYWPNHSWETRLSRQEEEEEGSEDLTQGILKGAVWLYH